MIYWTWILTLKFNFNRNQPFFYTMQTRLMESELKIFELDTLNLNIHCGHLWFMLNPPINNTKVLTSELKTFELDTLNLNIHCAFDQWKFSHLIARKISNFSASDRLFGILHVCIYHSDWLNFNIFRATVKKNKIILRLKKRAEINYWSRHSQNSKVFSSGYIFGEKF